jgi:hypothetical protein
MDGLILLRIPPASIARQHFLTATSFYPLYYYSRVPQWDSVTRSLDS